MPKNVLRTDLLGLFVILCRAFLAFGQGSSNVPLLAHVNKYASTGYSDLWGYTAPDGREYALEGVKRGTSIVDITNTNNPVEIRSNECKNLQRAFWRFIAPKGFLYLQNPSHFLRAKIPLGILHFSF
jgi:hypothetical protein